MLTALFYPSEVTDTKMTLRKSVPRRGISDLNSMGLSSLSLETRGCLQQPLQLQWTGSCTQGCGVGCSRKTRRKLSLPSVSCHSSSPLARFPVGSHVHAWLELEGKADMRPSLSRWAAVKDLPVELQVWEERSPSLPADFPAPSGTEPASHLVPFLPQQAVTGWQALSCTIRENKYPLHSPVGFLLCFSAIQWIKIVYLSQYSPRNCSIHTAEEAKSWVWGQERAGRKRNSEKPALQNPKNNSLVQLTT